MYSNIERIDRRTYENTHNWNSFGKKHSITERITQTADDCKIYRQNKYSILQGMNDCYSFCDKSR